MAAPNNTFFPDGRAMGGVTPNSDNTVETALTGEGYEPREAFMRFMLSWNLLSGTRSAAPPGAPGDYDVHVTPATLSGTTLGNPNGQIYDPDAASFVDLTPGLFGKALLNAAGYLDFLKAIPANAAGAMFNDGSGVFSFRKVTAADLDISDAVDDPTLDATDKVLTTTAAGDLREMDPALIGGGADPGGAVGTPNAPPVGSIVLVYDEDRNSLSGLNVGAQVYFDYAANQYQLRNVAGGVAGTWRSLGAGLSTDNNNNEQFCVVLAYRES